MNIQAREANVDASKARQTGYAKALLSNLAEKSSTVCPLSFGTLIPGVLVCIASDHFVIRTESKLAVFM